MSRVVGFAYAGARIQARYGRLVSRPTWERLERLETTDGFLQAARDTPLQAWVAQLDPATDGHRLEAQLRALFRQRVGELAQWAPPGWRAAVRWVDVLADLPAVNARFDGADAPWQRDDSRFGAIRVGPEAGVPEPLRNLWQAWRDKRPLVTAWLEQWRALWPPVSADERRALEHLLALLGEAQRGAARDAPAALAALQGPLRKLMRRQMRAPAGLFAYLALAWIEFAALRGALVRRRLALPVEVAA
jgi:hypothetical protein